MQVRRPQTCLHDSDPPLDVLAGEKGIIEARAEVTSDRSRSEVWRGAMQGIAAEPLDRSGVRVAERPLTAHHQRRGSVCLGRLSQSLGQKDIVAVAECDVSSSGSIDRCIPCHCRAAGLIPSEHPDAWVALDLHGIGTAVVDDDYLEVVERLVEDGSHRMIEMFLIVSARHHDAEHRDVVVVHR